MNLKIKIKIYEKMRYGNTGIKKLIIKQQCYEGTF